jgi:hypothetical protein
VPARAWGLVECDEAENHEVNKNNDGSFSMVISEQDAISIDMCEKSVLQIAYPTIREAVSNHLSQISKKTEIEAGEGKEIITNPHPSKVDGEIGRFTFITHSFFHESQSRYNTAQVLFTRLIGVEIYKTTGFKDIALIYGDTEQSYQKNGTID